MNDFQAFEQIDCEPLVKGKRLLWPAGWHTEKPPCKGWYVVSNKDRPTKTFLNHWAGYFNGKVWTTYQGMADPLMVWDIAIDNSPRIQWHHPCTPTEMRTLGRA